MAIGTSFQPGTEEMLRKRLNQSQLGPLQSEALRILSLRLPHVLSGSPIAPSDLLTPRVGGVDPSSLVDLITHSLGVPQPGPGDYHPDQFPTERIPVPGIPPSAPGPSSPAPRNPPSGPGKPKLHYEEPPVPGPRNPFPGGRRRAGGGGAGGPFGY